MRHIAHNLLPTTLEKEGLVNATKQFAEEINQTNLLNISVTDNSGNIDLTQQMQLMLFRIIQELVNNIIKHSQAQEATIHFNKKEDMLEVVVTDNGIGYQENSNSKSQGIYSISQRLKSIGGNFRIFQDKNSSGTKAVVQLKLG